MRKLYIYPILFLLYLSQILATGISPARYEIPYISGQTSILPFSVGGYNNITLEFSCTEWLSYNNDAHLNEEGWIGFTVTAKFPLSDLPKPGEHTCGFIVKEYHDPNIPESFSGIRAVTQVGGSIHIEVPFPEKYLFLTLSIDNVNKGDPVFAGVHVKNFGIKTIYNVQPTVELLDMENRTMDTFLTTSIDKLDSHQEAQLWKKIDTSKYEAGRYKARASFDYGGNSTAMDEKFFLMGKPYVHLVKTTENVSSGKLSEYKINIENWWGNTIPNIYAVVNVSNATISSDFKTISLDLQPWGSGQLTGYFDAKGFSEGQHQVDIAIRYYSNLETKYNATLYINEPEQQKKGLKISTQMVVIVALIIITLINIIFLVKRKKKSDQK